MTPDQMLKPLLAALHAWADAWAQIEIAKDPNNALELIAQGMEGPHGYNIVLLWNGDDPTDDNDLVPIVDNTIEIFVGRNEGLSLDPNDTLVRDVGDEKATYQVTSDVREFVRGFDYGDYPEVPQELTEKRLGYRGGSPVALPEGVPLAAYSLRFRLTTSLPIINLPDSFA